jgi:histidinol phosphatase-like PHP family hydrolase
LRGFFLSLDLLDCHNHTSDWSDGRQSIDQILEKSRTTGIRVGLSDHAGVGDYLNSDERLLAYADFLSQYPVARGYEMDLGRQMMVSKEVRSRFDYVIGSVHGLMNEAGVRTSFKRLLDWTKGEDPGFDPIAQFGAVETVFRRHLDLVLGEYEKQSFDILGHCSLVPPLALGDPEEVYPEWWEDGLVGFLKSTGVAMELSNRWKTPYPRLMKKAAAAGLRFAAGSDGHEPAHSCELSFPKRLITEYQVPLNMVLDVPRVTEVRS